MIAVVFVRALRIIAFVVFPLMFGLAAVSSDIVDLFIGQKWVAAAPLVLILCLSMPARIMGNLFPPALQGLGKPKSSLVNLAIAVIVMIPVLTYTASIDTYAVSLAWLVVYPIVLILMFNHSRALLELRWTESASAVLPPLLGSLAMFALVYWLGGQPLMTELAVEFRLVMTILSGMIIYLAFSLFVLRKQLAEFVALVRPQ